MSTAHNYKYDLSVVIPVFNEAETIEELIRKLDSVMKSQGLTYEIIVVDDGSFDRSPDTVKSLQEKIRHLKLICLRRNFGHHPATYAGFDYATGEIVVTLDADLQNDPRDIPKLLGKIKDGTCDVVCGWRKDRKDPFFSRRLPSYIANKMISYGSHIQIHDYGCFLRAYKNGIAKELSKHAPFKGWFPVLFRTLGLRVKEVEVAYHQRGRDGKSRHSLFTRLDQFQSVFMGITTKPFQVVEFLGMMCWFGGGIGFFIVLCLYLADIMSGSPALVLLLAALSAWGFLLLAIGLIGEYIVRMNWELQQTPKYLIKEIVDRDNETLR